MPGTWASLAALPCAAVLRWLWGGGGVGVAAAAVFAVGWWAASRVARASHSADPGYVVVDEIAGQLLALSLAPLDWRYYLAAFLLFRVFDIWKPFPVNWLDRRVGGGLGIMLDDAMAALYALLVIALGQAVLGIRS